MTFTGDPPPHRLNVARYCLAGKVPDKTALIIAGKEPQTWTYGALEDAVLRLGNGLLKSSVEPGDRVFIRYGNSVTYLIVFLATIAIGAVPIPASPQLTPHEVAMLLADSGARFLAWDEQLDLPDAAGVSIFRPADLERMQRGPAGDYADTLAHDSAYLVYTSGTSGKPKGVLHGQRAIWGRRPMYRGWYDIGPDDVMLHTGTFNWTYTLGTGLCDPFANGATAVVYTGERTPVIWEELARSFGATLFASVPGIYRQILRNGFKPSGTLRHALTAGEALPAATLEAWRNSTGLELFEALGMSEISTYISSAPSVPVRPGSPGKPQPGRSIRILENGQIGVHRSDPGLMLGYWGEDAPADEWFATGDEADIDPEGYVWYRGRTDDLMNAGGFRVSPLEVEAALCIHPDVAEAGVREWRVSDTTSIIAAFIVPKPGASPSETAILRFVSDRLAAYKLPKQIWFVPALPRTANGKLVRKALEKP